MERPDTSELHRLQQRRKDVWEQAHAIAAAASKEDRRLTVAEDQLFRMLSGELDRLTAEAAELRARLPRAVLNYTLRQKPTT
ncbi:hypothetical protein [Mycobacterium marinum]|uniref:hypothetical protein n=1 Tax=Mycobacterium marinum TaxID=1781 RepID=UPI003565CF2F